MPGFWSKLRGRKSNGADVKQQLRRIIDERLARSHFQPLVDLQTHELFAYEALARCTIEKYRSPPVLFDAAVESGLVGELGRLLRQTAVDACTEYPLFLNVHPHEFDQGWLVQPNDPIYWHNEQVYLEITESVPLHYFDQCSSVLAEARSKGVRLAVDDLGAGYSNLKYISDLSPEIVKIDRDLLIGMTVGKSRQYQLYKSIVTLCKDMGAKVVAEGIEEVHELEAVIEAGAHYGQGYLLARPAFPPPMSVWPGDQDDETDEKPQDEAVHN